MARFINDKAGMPTAPDSLNRVADFRRKRHLATINFVYFDTQAHLFAKGGRTDVVYLDMNPD